MKGLKFRKENGKEITIFNIHAMEKEDMVEDGVIRVLLKLDYHLDFENVKEIMTVFNYPSSDLSLQVSLIFNSIEDNGEVHFYLDHNHEELVKAFTEEEGLAFNREETKRFHLYIPEDLSNNSFQDIPVKNITII